MIVVADTGALYALVDRGDAWHERVRSWWVDAPRRVLIPTSVLPELCYLLQHRLGAHAELAFVRAVRQREFLLADVEDRDLPRIEQLLLQFRAFPLGYVDASVVAVAERVKAAAIVTTDRRHFPMAAPALTMVP